MKIGINQKIIALLLCSLTLRGAAIPADVISQSRSYSAQNSLAAAGLGFVAASAYFFLGSVEFLSQP